MILIESSQPVHSSCQTHLPSHPPEPSRPFQELAVDFCSYAGREFLIMVDCFTDWPDIVYMGSNTTTPRLIAALKAYNVWSDQGPQNCSGTLPKNGVSSV